MNPRNNEDQALEVAINDPTIRRSLTRQSFLYFFCFYLHHYMKFPLAEFHKEIIRIAEDMSNHLCCLVAFRGSAKSTLVTLAYCLWSILGKQEKKFVLIICQTQTQAKLHMKNIRHELETNALLKSDLGPFQDEKFGEWSMPSIVFKDTGARITIASADQSIRGMRHHEHRPDLILLDDIEDIASCKTKEGREKTFSWFTREVIPLGDRGTRIILVGNLLHEDSLMMRLKKKIEEKETDGIFKWYPLLDEKGVCLWPGKFRSPEMIETEHKKVANESAWQQEYLLNIVNDETRVIHPEWIHSYDELPQLPVKGIFVGVDLAISERESADCTSMVVILMYGQGKDAHGYVLPNPINRRMPFHETIETILQLNHTLKLRCSTPKFLIEENGFQAAYGQMLQGKGVIVKGIRNTNDKRSRLALTTYPMQNGTILFPKHGAEDLRAQLVGFGVERHDDLCDAFAMAVSGLVEEINKPIFKIFVG